MKITIHGDMPSKKNSRILSMRGGRVMSFPSKAYSRWHKEAMKELGEIRGVRFERIIKIRIELYPETLRKFDLTNKAESVMDALVDAGILADDNWEVVPEVEIKYMRKDKVNPRAECELKEV